MLAKHLVQLLLLTPTPSPSPASVGGASTGATAVQMWTLIVAGLAVVATLVSAYLLRRTGKGTVEAAQRAAQASERSAQASEKSADAAQQAVGVNRETAAGVAARAEADALAKRYQEAATQLGHARAAVRLAGVYALAKLADDWREQRQQCVDVLCAYLRMPFTQAEASEGDDEVRRTVVRIINAHVTRLRGQQIADELSWSPLNFDFSNATLSNFQLEVPHFGGHVSFAKSRFAGDSRIFAPTFDSGVDFSDAKVEGVLSVHRLTLQGIFDAERLSVAKRARLVIAQSWVTGSGHMFLAGTNIRGALQLTLHPSEHLHVDLHGVTLAPNSEIDVRYFGESFSATVQMDGWVVGSGAKIRLPSLVLDAPKTPWTVAGLPDDAVVTFED